MVVAQPPSRSPTRETGAAADVLRVANLGVRLDHVPILEDVSFHVRRGTTLAIVGPNGAGKTTLFRVLLFDEPTATVDIGSEDMLYEALNRLEKESNITVLLITHDIHIASQYSDAVLALNRTVRFFGAPSRLSEPDLLMEIFGSGSGLAEHKHDFGSRGFR